MMAPHDGLRAPPAASWFAASELRVGDRYYSPWRLAVLGGLVAGVLALLAVSAAAGASLLVALALVPPALVGFVALGLIRRWVLRHERTVLLEHLVFVQALWAGFLVASGQSALPWLDRLNTGLAVVLGFGRLGCLSSGCCYGVPSTWGVRYPPECHPEDPGQTRFPVQAVEAAFWLLAAPVSAAVTLRSTPGSGTAAILVSYGVLRWTLEGVRGDPRPSWLGISESRWLSGVVFTLGLMLDPGRWRGEALLLGVGAGATLILLGTRSRWLGEPHVSSPSEADLSALGRRLRESVSAQVDVAVSGNVQIASSALGDAVLVTLWRPHRALPAVLAREICEGIARGWGADAQVDLQLHGQLWRFVLEREAAGSRAPEVPVARATEYFNSNKSESSD